MLSEDRKHLINKMTRDEFEHARGMADAYSGMAHILDHEGSYFTRKTYKKIANRLHERADRAMEKMDWCNEQRSKAGLQTFPTMNELRRRT